MMELTACPPSAGSESTSATLRPRRAASSAAETPAMPAPSTQISADTCRCAPPAGRRTIRVAVEILALSVLIAAGWLSVGAQYRGFSARKLGGRHEGREARLFGHADPTRRDQSAQQLGNVGARDIVRCRVVGPNRYLGSEMSGTSGPAHEIIRHEAEFLGQFQSLENRILIRKHG